MDQIGDAMENLEAQMQVYLGGVGRVGQNVPRLSAYFELFVMVGESALAENIQYSIIKILQGREDQRDTFHALSRLAGYFKQTKRFAPAEPLSLQALTLCETLTGDSLQVCPTPNSNLNPNPHRQLPPGMS